MILALMITEQCNFICDHCMIEATMKNSLISDEVLERYYHMLQIGNPDEVYIMGGEPFLHLDKVEEVIKETKKYCTNIMVFSNGSFLLNESKSRRVRNMDVEVRISDDEYHRKKWTEKLKNKIYESGYRVVKRETGADMIPVGRAYEKYKHLEYNMGCSLLTGMYDGRYPNHHRYMVMLNGDVNLYCATVEGALANVFEDEDITYELLVQREKILHNYLMKEVIKSKEDTYMAVMCNRCSKYKVTSDSIFYEGQKVAKAMNYSDKRENKRCLPKNS